MGLRYAPHIELIFDEYGSDDDDDSDGSDDGDGSDYGGSTDDGDDDDGGDGDQFYHSLTCTYIYSYIPNHY
jgi:hypothetical protein